MSLLNTVRGRVETGSVALPAAKKLGSLPQIPGLPKVGAAGVMREVSLPAPGLLVKPSGAPSSLLSSFGVKSIER